MSSIVGDAMGRKTVEATPGHAQWLVGCEGAAAGLDRQEDGGVRAGEWVRSYLFLR